MAKALKNPLEAVLRIGFRTYVRVQGVVPFSHKVVAGQELPHFASRLYRESKLLKEALGDCRAEKSLEIGCGYGRLTPWIAENSSQHYAVEPEEELLRDAEKLNPGVKFCHAKAQQLPYPDAFFDLCVTWTVLQHIPPTQIEKAVEEIKRVCKLTAFIVLAEDIGERCSDSYWQRTLDEYLALMQPWQMVWHSQPIREEPSRLFPALVMRFQHPDSG